MLVLSVAVLVLSAAVLVLDTPTVTCSGVPRGLPIFEIGRAQRLGSRTKKKSEYDYEHEYRWR